MRKIFLMVIVLATAIVGNGQSPFPIQQSLGSSNTLVYSRGGFRADSAMILPAFADTTAANRGPWPRYYAGNLIRTGDQIWYRNNTHTKWIELTGGGGGGGSGLDSIAVHSNSDRDSLYEYSGGDSTLVHIFDRHCGIVSPGFVTSDSNLTITITPSIAISCCDGIRRTYSQTTLTLAAANVSNPRYDAIVLDEASSMVVAITGTASSNPVFPQPGDCQMVLTYIYIPANATTPGGFFEKVIYDENVGAPTEWPGAATSVTTNFAGTTAPYHLTKVTDAGTITSSSRLDYTGTDSVAIATYTVLDFFIKLKSTFAANTRFQISFWNDGVQKSTIATLQHGSYGFDRTLVGTWQKITIPISPTFSFSNNYVDAIRFQSTGSNANGFYLDWITLQGGISQPPGSGGGVNDRFGVEDNSQTQSRYFNSHDSMFFHIDSTRSYVITTNGNSFGYRIKDFKQSPAPYGPDIFHYGASEYLLDPLTTARPFTINNLPQSDTASYLIGINTSNRLVRQTKSVFSTPTLQQVFDVETGEAQLNKHDTIALATDKALYIRGSHNATGDAMVRIINTNNSGGTGNAGNLHVTGSLGATGGNSYCIKTDGPGYGLFAVQNVGWPAVRAIGSGTQNTVEVTNSGSGAAINAAGGDPVIVSSGVSSGGVAVQATSGNNIALQGISTGAVDGTALPLRLEISPGAVPDAVNYTMAKIFRETGSSANVYPQMSGSFNYYLMKQGGTLNSPTLVNQYLWQWMDTTRATPSSIIKLTNLVHTNLDTAYEAGDYVPLSEGSATVFKRTVIGTGKAAGGEVIVNIFADDGTDFQTRTIRFIWSAVNKAGTLTFSNGTTEEDVSASAGTLTATLTLVDSGSGRLDFKLNATSSLSQTTLRATYQVWKNY